MLFMENDRDLYKDYLTSLSFVMLWIQRWKEKSKVVSYVKFFASTPKTKSIILNQLKRKNYGFFSSEKDNKDFLQVIKSF
jgi:hypothetical protein